MARNRSAVRWTDDMDDQLILLIENGTYTQSQIAEIMGITTNNVIGRLVKLRARGCFKPEPDPVIVITQQYWFSPAMVTP